MLKPEIQPSETATNIALVNIITTIEEAIQEEGVNLASEWAEASGKEDSNIFMIDSCKEILAQMLAGFIDGVQPRATQFTDAHASAYLGIDPAAKDPVK